MHDRNRYQVSSARDDVTNLQEVLEYIATKEGHVRIVSVTWQPERTGPAGEVRPAGYTIISEMKV